MPDLNRANRQVADVDIRILKTMKPFLFFNTANTTTAGLTGDSVYAMAKGGRRIAFQNPIEGTMTIEAQVYPFKLFALMSDGAIKVDGVYAEHEVVTAASGKLTITVPEGATIKDVFVYPKGEYGDESALIAGTYSEGAFTPAEGASVTDNTPYEVGYMVSKSTGVKRVSFNDNAIPPDYYITQKTVDKCEDGSFSTFLMTAYKATIQRNFELSFSSEGDPATVNLTFDLMADGEGNVLDFTEI